MSIVYLWAFASLYYQIPGLYADDGVLPVSSVLKCDSPHLLDCAFFGTRPNFLHLFVHWFSLSPVDSFQLAAIFGIFISSLSIVFNCCQCCSVYLTLWYLYFSSFQVGQVFLWFQWDTFILESGFLCILVAPFRIWRNSWLPHDNVTFFLVRWLAFRFMFASGVVKLTSNCPTWWSLTALHYHYQSQCIPNAPAYFAHQMPDWLKKLSVSITFFDEILVPPLFLVPIKLFQKFHIPFRTFDLALTLCEWTIQYFQVTLMLLIMMTGNFNFFNFHYAFVCLSILVDSDGFFISTSRLGKYRPRLYHFLSLALFLATITVLFYWFIRLFSIRISLQNGFTVLSDINFSKSEFQTALRWSIPLLLTLGSICFFMEIIAAFIRLKQMITCSLGRLPIMISCILMCFFATIMFAISTVPYSWLEYGTNRSIWPSVIKLHRYSDKFQLTHSYGLFRSMTGVGGRPEVIIEGADNLDGPWEEYEFPYKIGSLQRRPPFIIPHQPRLDWQLWFAALGSYQHNPWFISLVYKIMNNHSSVLSLIETDPFTGKDPPSFMRAHLYLYHFTKIEKEGLLPEQWWRRTYKSKYMPEIGKNDPVIVDYLTGNGLIVQNRRTSQPSLMLCILNLCRSMAMSVDGPTFVWMTTTAVVIAFISRKTVHYIWHGEIY